MTNYDRRAYESVLVAAVIRGTVRDSAGLPVSRARAYFVSGPGPYPDIAGMTDEQGRFALSAPSPGTYGVACSAEGFASELTSVEVPGTGEVHVEIRLDRPSNPI